MGKFVLNILLSVLMIVSTTGLAVSQHYCGGKHHSTHIGKVAPSCCKMVGVEMNGCCHNKKAFNQVDDDVSANASVTFVPLALPTTKIFSEDAFLDDLFSQDAILNTHAPPPGIPPDRQILFQTFRI